MSNLVPSSVSTQLCVQSDVVTIIDAVAGKELKKARFAFEVNEMAWDKNGYLFLSVGEQTRNPIDYFK